MRKQRESNFVWFIAIFTMLTIIALRCFNSTVDWDIDGMFLYNRCYQLWDCLKHGFYPFIYYNDVGGIGYASPIFYGQLTLVPFIPFLGSVSGFINMYFTVRVILTFFGFRCFLKRISNYATLGACFYIVGLPFIMHCGVGLYAAGLGTAFSWFFFAFCIDYFRDGKSIWLLILTYFLIWQSNFNAVIFATVVCFCIFCYYFRVDRWRDYIKLFGFVFVLVAYDLVNMFIHMDALRLVNISSWFAKDVSNERLLLSWLPFGGFIFRGILYGAEIGDLCCGFMQFGILAVFIVSLVRGFKQESLKFRVCSLAILGVTFVGYIAGGHNLWGSVYEVTGAFFQFPIRYMILFYGFVIAIMSRVMKPRWFELVVLLGCVVDILVANPLTIGTPSGESDFVFKTIAYGEYAGKNFVDGMNTYNTYAVRINSEKGYEYFYTNDYNGLTIDCSENAGGDIITVPKLYYNGYKAVGVNGEMFFVSSGYSNYCQLAIGDYTGVITLRYYVHPIVFILFIIQSGWFLFIAGRCLFEEVVRSKRLDLPNNVI